MGGAGGTAILSTHARIASSPASEERDHALRILRIGQESRRLAQQNQLFGAERHRERRGHGVGIDVQQRPRVAPRDRAHHRQGADVEQSFQQPTGPVADPGPPPPSAVRTIGGSRAPVRAVFGTKMCGLGSLGLPLTRTLGSRHANTRRFLPPCSTPLSCPAAPAGRSWLRVRRRFPLGADHCASPGACPTAAPACAHCPGSRHCEHTG